MPLIDDIKNAFRDSGVIAQIILINIAVFLIVNIGIAVNTISGDPVDSLLPWLAFHSGLNSWLSRPWTIITYMFYHQGIFHLLFNMLWLFWMGKILIEFANTRVFIALYLLGGICGAILFSIVYSLIPSFPQGVPLLGASAGVMAIVIGVAVLVPNLVIHLMFLGPVKLKYVALTSFIISSLIDLSENTGGKVAHIGGALVGLIFILQYKNGNDASACFTKLIAPLGKLFSRSAKMKVVHKKKMTDEEYNLNKKMQQIKTDEILDKISKSGYDSLTKAEKDFLFTVSRKK